MANNNQSDVVEDDEDPPEDEDMGEDTEDVPQEDMDLVDTPDDMEGDADLPDEDVSDVPQDDMPDDGDVPDEGDMTDVPDEDDMPDDMTPPDDMDPDVPLIACEQDNECPAEQHCEESQCVPGCHNDDGCVTGQICDLDTNTCGEPRCTEDTECAPGAHCGPDEVCIPGCHNDDGCSEELVCDTEAHECVQEGCREDSHCPGLMTCDLDSGECQSALLCISQDDCGEGLFCVDGSCLEQAPECINNTDCGDNEICLNNECEMRTCLNDDQCSTGRYCISSNLCGECREDTHCPGTQTCSASNTCVEAGACTVDDDCLGTRTCQGGTCAPIACTPDAQEPDDTQETATVLSEDTMLTASMCSGESDYFRVTPGLGNGFILLVNFDDEDGFARLEANLYDPSGIQTQTFFPDGGQFTTYVEESALDGDWHIEVRHAAGDVIPYTVQYVFREGGVCINDTAEPNNTRMDASPVTSRRHIGRICTQDTDWWRVDLEVGSTSELRMRTTTGEGAISLEVFGEDMETPLARDVSPQELKTLTLDASQGTEQWIRLFSTEGNQAYQYLLEIVPQ